MFTILVVIGAILVALAVGRYIKAHSAKKRAELLKAHQKKINDRKLYKNMEEWFVR